MRFFEFKTPLREDVEYIGDLLSVLNYFLENAKDKKSNGKFKMSSIISRVQNRGSKTFEYTNFVKAYETSEAVKKLVSNYNKEYVTLNIDQDSGEGAGTNTDKQDQADTVSKMAKKAVKI